MKKSFLIILFLTVFTGASFYAQPAERRTTRNEYIEKYKDDAITEMIRSGVPASITLAQGILESGDGNSPLARYGNNHFGVKCHSDWKGKTMRIDDDKKDECFRKYESVKGSFRDHSNFLTDRSRYAFLFDLKITDYKGWAKGLKKAGYATNPKYANILIKLIEQHELYQYDKYDKVSPKKPTRKKITKAPVAKKARYTVKLHNNIKYIVAKKGDTFYGLAKSFGMNVWQIYKYNDLNKDDVLYAGDIIYLQPKRNKAKNYEEHIVKKGDTMRNISQLYGVKLRKLYKKNGLAIGSEPNVGDKISLRKKRR